jgi:hypothetical protein
MAATEGLALPGAPPAPRAGLRRRGRALISEAYLPVVALTVAGGILRVLVARQSVFADELSTYWISVRHSLGGVLSLMYSTGRIQHAEITPPLSFLASWLTTRAGGSAELLRLPELIAGTATIPLVYVLGLRCVGRRAALLACALTALSPFMIYYSAEARAYGLLMFLVLCAVLSLLRALEGGGRRYWVLYALFSGAAFYTHYTCVFILAAALAWTLWAHPEARRAALMTNVGAALLVVPWIPGLIADLQSPTLTILSALAKFDPHALRVDFEHWAVGYPYAQAPTLPSARTGLADLPGLPALVILAAGLIVGLVGIVRAMRQDGGLRRPRKRTWLVVLLLVATPVGEIVVSATGNHVIGVRDLAASWPFFALSLGALVSVARTPFRQLAAALILGSSFIGAATMLNPDFSRPQYQGAAQYVTAHLRPGDVVLDETGGLSPGPLTGFDVAFHSHATVVRALAPAERDHPWTFFDPKVTLPAAVRMAVAAAHGGRVFVVGAEFSRLRFPQPYRLVALRRYAGIERTDVGLFAAGEAPR